MTNGYTEYRFRTGKAHANAADRDEFLLDVIRGLDHVKTVLDAGCGTGRLVAALHDAGYQAHGFDLSESGMQHARESRPDVAYAQASVYDDYRRIFPGIEAFDVVVSSEVVEHLYQPAVLAQRCYEALRPGGWVVVTTPYHGYAKNLMLALTGRMDRHFTALWEGGHIKFWSARTLSELLRRAGFAPPRFVGLGRIPGCWKSMVLIARKPAEVSADVC